MKKFGRSCSIVVVLTVLFAVGAVAGAAEKSGIQIQDKGPGAPNQSGIADSLKLVHDFKVDRVWITEDVIGRTAPVTVLIASKKYTFHCAISFAGSIRDGDKQRCFSKPNSAYAYVQFRYDNVLMHDDNACAAQNEVVTVTAHSYEQGAGTKLGTHEFKCSVPNDGYRNTSDTNWSNNEKSMNYQVVLK